MDATTLAITNVIMVAILVFERIVKNIKKCKSACCECDEQENVIVKEEIKKGL